MCAKERFFWLFTNQKVPFFLTKVNRIRYYDIYNYYIFSYLRYSYLEKYPLLILNFTSDLSLLDNQKGKIINMVFQELDNAKKFLYKLHINA